MKKKRSLCAALLAGLMVTAVCLTGCGQKTAGNGSSGVDSDKVYQVAAEREPNGDAPTGWGCTAVSSGGRKVSG